MLWKGILLFFMLLVTLASANDNEDYTEISSWEPDDVKTIYAAFDATEPYISKTNTLIALALINLYQKKISSQSVDRCPFYISCSSYAGLAIKKYGLLIGICFFIDRNLYRENRMCYYHYELRQNDNGILKLDDSFYLYGQ